MKITIEVESFEQLFELCESLKTRVRPRLDGETPIEALQLSNRTTNILKRLEINTVEQLKLQNQVDLLMKTNPSIGRKTLNEILAKVKLSPMEHERHLV